MKKQLLYEEYDPLEMFLSKKDWRERPFHQVTLPVALGLGRQEVSVSLPQGMETLFGQEPWEPVDLLKCVAAAEGKKALERLWPLLLQKFRRQLADRDLAPEITDRVVEEAFGGDHLAALWSILREPESAQTIFSCCVTASPLCLSLLWVCLEEGWGKKALWLLTLYKEDGKKSLRWPKDALLTELLEGYFYRGRWSLEGEGALREMLLQLPFPQRKHFWPLWKSWRKNGREQRKAASEPQPPAYGGRPGEEAMRLVINRQTAALQGKRPWRLDGLFLDLVLLGRGKRGWEESLPLWNGQGEEIGRVPLERLPRHQRNMVRCMQKKGQRVFACLDSHISLPEAGLWCAALYWRKEGAYGKGEGKWNRS